MLLVRNTWVPCPTNMSAPPDPEWKESGRRFLCLSWLVRRSTFLWNICYRGTCSCPAVGEVPSSGHRNSVVATWFAYSVACSILHLVARQSTFRATRIIFQTRNIISKLILVHPLQLPSPLRTAMSQHTFKLTKGGPVTVGAGRM